MNDQQQFLVLCDQERDNIYRYIFLRVGYHRETSEDLTQEIFLKVWQARASYDESKASLRTWLFRIAHNTLIDHYRKQSRIVETDLDQATLAVESDELNPALKASLLQALDQLDHQYRELIVLRYIEGLEIKEIAQITNRSYIATKVATHRAFTRLKKILNEKQK